MMTGCEGEGRRVERTGKVEDRMRERERRVYVTESAERRRVGRIRQSRGIW